ncbi:hypothetical protein PPYR_10942 [Photinus pyralis]|uniref:Uncharacterized protein n=1 Tax=Photinus pyralis TaxID=7054 RepID=A0A5N4AHV0_PHOPY|nr:hypothetical protein PPYR_10942 [Photinus pyralis]
MELRALIDIGLQNMHILNTTAYDGLCLNAKSEIIYENGCFVTVFGVSSIIFLLPATCNKWSLSVLKMFVGQIYKIVGIWRFILLHNEGEQILYSRKWGALG